MWQFSLLNFNRWGNAPYGRTNTLFLEVESIPDEYSVNIVEMTIKYLECYINFVDKAVVRFERIDSKLKNILQWLKCYKSHCVLQRSHLWEEKWIGQTLLSYFKKFPVTPAFSNHCFNQQLSTLRQDSLPPTRLLLTVGSDNHYQFFAIKIQVYILFICLCLGIIVLCTCRIYYGVNTTFTCTSISKNWLTLL